MFIFTGKLNTDYCFMIVYHTVNENCLSQRNKKSSQIPWTTCTKIILLLCRHTVLSQTSCQYKKHLLNRPTWIFQIYVWEIDHELLVYFFVCKNKKAFQGYFSTCMTKENPSPLFTYLQIFFTNLIYWNINNYCSDQEISFDNHKN